MTVDKPHKNSTRLCPTCGTRLSADASRCLVCGADLSGGAKPRTRLERTVQSSNVPSLSLSLPIVLLLGLLFLMIGSALAYFALQQTNLLTVPTPVPSDTPTATPSLTPTPITPTATLTPLPSPTPITYIVKLNDTCGGIALAFNVSVQSIVLENNLSADCILSVNQELRIPQPTPTNTPEATLTLSGEEATRAACPSDSYVVQEDDNLSIIALVYGIPEEAIMEWNSLTTDNLFIGQRLEIPLCKQVFVGGATVTPSPAPPYPAPELLLPSDGQAFTAQDASVTLQWSSVGALRENEAYQVTIIDITEGRSRKLVDEVTDTKFTVPASFRPGDGAPHAFRWYVVPVAQVGVDDDGNPVWVAGGPASNTFIFTWSGAAVTPTPTP